MEWTKSTGRLCTRESRKYSKRCDWTKWALRWMEGVHNLGQEGQERMMFSNSHGSKLENASIMT